MNLPLSSCSDVRMALFVTYMYYEPSTMTYIYRNVYRTYTQDWAYMNLHSHHVVMYGSVCDIHVL